MSAPLLFVAAAVVAGGLADFSGGARRELESRISATLAQAGTVSAVSGTVTFANDEFFFVQDGIDALKVLTKGTVPRKKRGTVPSAGDVVSVYGRPVLEGGRVVMAADGWKTTSHTNLPESVASGADSLVYAGTSGDCPRDSRDVNWRRVKVVGRAMGRTENGFSLEVADGLLISVMIGDRPSFIDDCERLHPKVSVQGVAELFLDQSALSGRGRYVIGVRLCVASEDDVTLLPDIGYQMRLHERRVAIALWTSVGLLIAGLVVLMLVLMRHRRDRHATAMVMADRKRMADDLHDTIEQHLAGAGMLLKLARMPANKLPERADRPIREAQDILVRAKREMREIVWGLKNDDMMRKSPAEMLREMAADMTRQGLFRVRTRLEGLPERMDGGKMRDLSLIVREAIGNAVRHGHARKIAVTCDPVGEGPGWVLRVANDGRPFDRASALGPGDGHFGLEGMSERARRIGAELAFDRKGKWTIAIIERH